MSQIFNLGPSFFILCEKTGNFLFFFTSIGTFVTKCKIW